MAKKGACDPANSMATDHAFEEPRLQTRQGEGVMANLEDQLQSGGGPSFQEFPAKANAHSQTSDSDFLLLDAMAKAVTGGGEEEGDEEASDGGDVSNRRVRLPRTSRVVKQWSRSSLTSSSFRNREAQACRAHSPAGEQRQQRRREQHRYEV